MERMLELHNEPMLWATAHLNQIQQTLMRRRDIEVAILQRRVKLFGEPAAELEQDKFDFRFRHLTEMPLCLAWEQIERDCGLPSGFTVREGAVAAPETTVNYTKGDNEPHTYLERRDEAGRRIVFCLTSAQFVFPEDYNIPEKGQRMRKMREKAVQAGRPDLYRILPYNIGVVYGEVNDIERVLGIRFDQKLHGYVSSPY